MTVQLRRAAWLAVAVAASAPAWGQAPDGVALFAKHCATCHQPDGSGVVGLAPALKGEHWAKLGADRGYLPTVIVHGLSGPIKVGSLTFVGSMPAFTTQLDDASIAAIATHLRVLQGARDDKPYAADDIAAVRKASGSPPGTRQLRVKLLGG